LAYHGVIDALSKPGLITKFEGGSVGLVGASEFVGEGVAIVGSLVGAWLGLLVGEF